MPVGGSGGGHGGRKKIFFRPFTLALLKCPCDKKKITSFFSSDYESVFA